MSYYFINGETLTNIADAIREKTGFSNPLAPGEMATAITNIENAGSGGSDPGTETEVLLISEEVAVDTAIQGTSLTLLSNNSFIADNCNNENLFVILSSIELSEIDSSAYSNCY